MPSKGKDDVLVTSRSAVLEALLAARDGGDVHELLEKIASTQPKKESR